MTISDTFLGVTDGESDRRDAPGGIGFATIRDIDGFAELRPEWDRLFAEVTGQPYGDHAYLAAWFESYGAGHRPEIRVARQGGRLVGILPLCRTRRLGAVRPAGFDRIGLFGAILDPRLSQPETVLAGLMRCGYGQYQVFEGVEAADAELFRRAARLAGMTSRIKQVFTANFADISRGGDAWLASLGKNARRSIKRSAKALEGPEARWILGTDCQSRAIEGFLEACRTSWKTSAGTGFAGSPEGPAFLRALGRHSRPGALHVTALFQGDTPVGGCFSSIKGDTLYINSIEFNEAMAPDGPGRFLMCRTIEQAAAMGLKRMDLMRSGPMNRSLAAGERPLFRVTLHRPGDPSVHVQRLSALRRRLVRAGKKGLSPRARYHATEGGHEA